MQIRQGDVFLKRINKIPHNTKKKNTTLAYGEITGHHHSFAKQALVSVFADADGKQYCDVQQESILEHQDHAHVKVPAGIYEVVIQREFDQVEGVRQVMD